jgi:hypothetical protein
MRMGNAHFSPPGRGMHEAREYPARAQAGGVACQGKKKRPEGRFYQGLERILVPVLIRLVRAFHRYPDIFGLLGPQRRQVYADALQVQPGDFFIQVLR